MEDNKAKLNIRDCVLGCLVLYVLFGNKDKEETVKNETSVPNSESVATQPALSTSQTEIVIPEPVVVEPVVTEPVATEPVAVESAIETPTVETLSVGDRELAVFAEEWTSIWKTMGYESAAIGTLTVILKKNDSMINRGALTAVLERQSSELRKFQSLDVPQSLKSVVTPFLTHASNAENTCTDFRNTVINPLYNFEKTSTYIKLGMKLKDYGLDMIQLYSSRTDVETTLYSLIPKDEISSSSFSEFFSNYTSGNNSTSTEMNYYILPDSGRYLLTDADVADLDASELRLARNEIYARYGRKFLDAGLTEWFNAQQWYQNTLPKYEPSEFDNLNPSPLSAIDFQNLELILAYEAKL